MAQTLKLRARAGRHIADRAALAAGARRFFGRSTEPHRTAKGLWPFPRVASVEVPYETAAEKHAATDYVLAARHGDVVALDEATAKLLGVKWAEHQAWLAESEAGEEPAATLPPAAAPEHEEPAQ